MCSKLEGIFKHIGLMAWTHSWSDMAFKFQKTKKWSEKHETLLDVMSCHQDDVVKKWLVWRKFGHTPSQTGATHLKVPGSETEQCMFDDEWEIPLTAFKCFLRLTCTNTTVLWKFGKFQGSFDLLKTFKWFSNHLMTVIQIWTTSTCNA